MVKRRIDATIKEFGKVAISLLNKLEDGQISLVRRVRFVVSDTCDFSKDKVNPAKNRTFGGIAHDGFVNLFSGGSHVRFWITQNQTTLKEDTGFIVWLDDL